MLAAGTLLERLADAAEDVDARFRAIAAEYAATLVRVARGYEADEQRQQDLVQDMLFAIWSALPRFEGRASVRTWVYRIAHNVAVSHVLKQRRDALSRAVPIEDAKIGALVRDAAREAEGREAVQKLAALVRALRPADAQIVLLYLEGLEHDDIAEITGLSRENVAVKIHRIKGALTRAMQEGEVR